MISLHSGDFLYFWILLHPQISDFQISSYLNNPYINRKRIYSFIIYIQISISKNPYTATDCRPSLYGLSIFKGLNTPVELSIYCKLNGLKVINNKNLLDYKSFINLLFI